MIAYELSNIRFRYDNALLEALQGVNWLIESGVCYGLLGPNGAGKTTLMRLLCGDLAPSNGTIHLFGSVLPSVPRHRIGIVPQEIALYMDFSAEENLLFWGKLNGLTGSLLQNRVEKMLARIGLSDRKHDRAKSFSGGMKRRLNFGCGILHEPDVILLDEPTVGVDPQSRNHLFEWIEELIATGRTVLYSTHYMEEAERLCNEIAIIDHGNILAQGARNELLAQSKLPTQLVLSFATPAEADVARNNEELAKCGKISRIGDEILVDLAVPLQEALSVAGSTGYSGLRVRRPSLESLFLSLTGHSLRE